MSEEHSHNLRTKPVTYCCDTKYVINVITFSACFKKREEETLQFCEHNLLQAQMLIF